MVKVKICGITNLEDAKGAAKAGADALGFVFYKKSLRYISPVRASKIIKELPSRVIKIGVFVNAKERTIKQIAKLCSIDMLQFHGNESPEFCQRFKSYKIIKAFRIKDKLDVEKILKYKTFAYLFDTFVKFKPGGTGKAFSWQLISGIKDLKRPIFLSGGLTSENTQEAINAIHPGWVDVSSSVEKMPGKKDLRKIKEFIKVAKSNF